MASSIRLSRASGYRDKARAYKVLIDGTEVGTIKDGQEEVFDVAPGTHTLRLKIDWCGSQTLEATVPEGGEASYRCAAGGNALAAAFQMIFTPGRYILLEPADA